MVNVVTEITINCPISKVSEYATNPDHAPEWYVNIKSVEWKTPKPLRLGSQIAFKASFLGRELAYVYEIVEFIPQKKFAMKTANGPFPMETVYTWQAIDENHTRMILQNKGNPKGFNKIMSLFMPVMMRRANIKDLKKIKANLERQSI
nr:SRPBCC family protein [Fredinandcohnia onubensis]